MTYALQQQARSQSSGRSGSSASPAQRERRGCSHECHAVGDEQRVASAAQLFRGRAAGNLGRRMELTRARRPSRNQRGGICWSGSSGPSPRRLNSIPQVPTGASISWHPTIRLRSSHLPCSPTANGLLRLSSSRFSTRSPHRSSHLSAATSTCSSCPANSARSCTPQRLRSRTTLPSSCGAKVVMRPGSSPGLSSRRLRTW